MNSHKFQKLIMDEVFESKKGGAPVTVQSSEGFLDVETFVWCQGCDQFHIITKDMSRDPHREDEPI